MRGRLVLAAAVLATWASTGGAALAHGGGGHGGGGHHPPPPADRPRESHGDRHGGERAHQRATFSLALTGAQVPGSGDPNGRGQATLQLDPARETVCLRANWRGLQGDVTALHIHRAPEGRTGPHHIEILNDERLTGAQNQVEFCVRVAGGHHGQEAGPHGGAEPADVIQAVVDDPGQFYLNVHSTAFPEGAIRGQIG
ncbi:MAG TPA: CHRD domain-containing protein [Acidimicrobiia bacterium]|nr:CHRD domain-containing protein [Acidimicrobiia bacterium]